MEIIENYLLEHPLKKQILFSDFVKDKRPEIIRHMILQSKDNDEFSLEMHWVRLFQRARKQSTIRDRQFLCDKNVVDWLKLNGQITEGLANIAEQKIKQLDNKRRKLHNELHLQAHQKVVDSLKVGESSNTVSNTDDEIDNFFGSGPSFSLLTLLRELDAWKENAQRVDYLHKQDLLFYNILDFVTTRPDASIKTILHDNYTSVMKYLQSLSVPIEAVEKDVVELMVADEEYIYLLSKKIVDGRFDDNDKLADICKQVYRIVNKQFKDDLNVFTDTSINEYQFTMAFVYPVFDELFDNISKNVLYQKWGECKLMCAKQDEHSALSDAHRRTPDPTIDSIFTIPCLNHTEFFAVEVSGGPAVNDFEHFLGDRNKIAKNLKIMMKFISSFHVKNSSLLSSLKLYGLQIYKYEVFVYSLTSPISNRYMFSLEMKFDLPIIPLLLARSFPTFMQNMWRLKKMIISSHKSVVHFVMKEDGNNDEDSGSDMSSPCVSPTKRKENK